MGNMVPSLHVNIQTNNLQQDMYNRFLSDILPLKNELYRLALRITQNAAEAEDVVQETLIKVWNRRNDWQNIESLEAFCMTICRNQALDHLRHLDYQAQSLDDAIDPADHSMGANPEEQTIQRNRVELVRLLIEQLPEKQRTCLQLREMEGKSYRDIATIMNISEEQVKVNIFRARQSVRARFLKVEQ